MNIFLLFKFYCKIIKQKINFQATFSNLMSLVGLYFKIKNQSHEIKNFTYCFSIIVLENGSSPKGGRYYCQLS